MILARSCMHYCLRAVAVQFTGFLKSELRNLAAPLSKYIVHDHYFLMNDPPEPKYVENSYAMALQTSNLFRFHRAMTLHTSDSSETHSRMALLPSSIGSLFVKWSS